MTETVRNEIICYRNEAFAIHHVIADCPPFTVVRELLKRSHKQKDWEVLVPGTSTEKK